ncbi:hypothetical protein [Microseira wollei]|uniref:hypothetical protein n=1 Tax=Microseira wollei TaxID=467598 RepID=UPI001CFF1798|nr:hypothetical protein [Microseira wollei]
MPCPEDFSGFLCRGTAREICGTTKHFMIADDFSQFICRGTAGETFGTTKHLMIAVPRGFFRFSV